MNLEQLGNLGELVSDVAVLESLASDASLTELLLRGYNRLQDLNEVERYRFDLSMARYLDNASQTLADYHAGAFPPERYQMMRGALKQFLSTPGMTTWWAEMKSDWFIESFLNEVDAILTGPQIRMRPFRGRSYPQASEDL